MNDAPTQSLEDALAKAEADADVALKAATSVVNTLKRYRAAARQGTIRELRQAGEAARRSLQVLDQEVANVAESWEFEEETYLQTGGYSEELIARGRDEGLRISQQDGRLFSYPVLLRVLASERVVTIDRARERRLRPSVLVNLLKDAQKRPPRFRPSEFLQGLYGAYRARLGARGSRAAGPAVVPLTDLYELLTLLPGTTREYSRQEFARDVYLLDQSGETKTRTGETLEFHASTGTKAARGTLTVVTQGGTEKSYYAIAFSSPPDSAPPED